MLCPPNTLRGKEDGQEIQNLLSLSELSKSAKKNFVNHGRRRGKMAGGGGKQGRRGKDEIQRTFYS